MQRSRIWALLALLAFIGASPLASQRKKKKEEKEITQVLEIPRDLPQAVVVDSQRLGFVVAPLSNKGLFSQQVRDGIKALWNAARGASIVRIRAFVAGSGDLRRVPPIVSEMFTDKRQALPTVTVVQVGALPLEGAQVILEAVTAEKKQVNPHGVAFIAGQPAKAEDATGPLRGVLGKAGLKEADVRRITCFLNSLDHAAPVRTQVTQVFPQSSFALVQLRRDSFGDFVECEAVAALNSAPARTPEFQKAPSGMYSDVMKIGPTRLIYTGAVSGLSEHEKDVRLVFDRLAKALESAGGTPKAAVMTGVYPLTRSAAEMVRKLRFQYLDQSAPPASTLLQFEGLSSLETTFAIDAVALSSR